MSRVRVGVKLALCICATALLLVVAVLTTNVLAMNKSLAMPEETRSASAIEATRAELLSMRGFADVDRSFTPLARAAFEREIDALLERVATLDRAALEMGIAKAVALAENGHTNVRGVSYAQGLPSLPLRLGWFSDGLYVLSSAPQWSHLLGARVVDEGGMEPLQLMRRLEPYVGGTTELKHLLALNFMVAPAALHAIGVLPSASEASFTFVLRDGSTITQSIVAMSEPYAAKGTSEPPVRDLSPLPPANHPDWNHVLQDVPLPLYVRDPETWYWRAFPKPDTLYVHFRKMRDQPTAQHTLSEFLDEVLREVREQNIRDAIVDLRASPGGDYSKVLHFSKELPRLLPAQGKLSILIGPNTFSAAIVTAARLKYFGGERAVLIGEPMADHARFWAEGKGVTLPYSGIVIRYSTAFHDWSDGCSLADLLRCYWLNYWAGVPAGSLEPAVLVPLSFADYLAGRDVVLDVAMSSRRSSP